MGKSADAFRTISEVADWLETPAHVLRFWESKFSQVKPVKRAGGRRYYRPADMLLLGGIKKLLHDDGMTIKGVQKLLREQGVKHVAQLSPPLDDLDGDAGITVDAQETSRPEGATVLDFSRGSTAPDAKADPTAKDAGQGKLDFEDIPPSETEQPSKDANATSVSDESDALTTPPVQETPAPPPEAPPIPESVEASADETDPDISHTAPVKPDDSTGFDHSPDEPAETAAPLTENSSETTTAEAAEAEQEPAAKSPPAPAPDNIDLPDDPPDTIAADSGVLARLSRRSSVSDSKTSKRIAALAERLHAAIHPDR